MALPIRFRNVHYYRIAGKYIFAGDFFITREHLYFFPEVDLQEQREKASKYLPHEIGLLAAAIIYVCQRVGGSYMSRVDFWQDNLSDQEFQTKAGAYIERLKFGRMYRQFGATMPLPTHVYTKEISDMRLSRSGKLSFVAQSDTHDFNIGLRRQKQLRNALWEAGLGRV